MPNSPSEDVVSLLYVITVLRDPELVLELGREPRDLWDLWDLGESGGLCLGRCAG